MSYKMSRIKWSQILMLRIEPIARLKFSWQKPAIRYALKFASPFQTLTKNFLCHPFVLFRCPINY